MFCIFLIITILNQMGFDIENQFHIQIEILLLQLQNFIRNNTL